MASSKHRFAYLIGASALCLSGTAFAQQAPAAETTAEDIVVTGSRVIKNGDSSPSPVTVVQTQDLYKANPGASLAEALNSLPTFAGSRGATSNPTTAGSAAGGNGGANQLNLRNLDPTRTLVLMDSKRVPPTLYNGVVDVDIIPQMLVQRVDVVTGGVSAVYGSDAVSGVVNYIIDKKFTGLKVDASYGLTQYGDGTKADIGAAWGAKLGDRGHVELSYEFRKEGGIERRTDRDWLNQVGVTGTGTSTNPYVLQTNLRQSSFPFGGLVTGTAGTLNNMVFKSDGTLSAFVPGATTGTTGVQVGGDGGYWDSGLVAKLKGHQIFGRFDYELADTVRFYAQVSGNLKTNSNVAETNQLNGVNISKTNAFLSPTYQALIPESQFKISKFLGNAPRVGADAESTQWIYNAGLEGDVGQFSWGLDYVHGISKLKTEMHNVINRQKLGYALDAVFQNGTSGPVVCNVTLSNPGLANDCVPLNVFGPTAGSAAAIDYVTDDVHFNSSTVMDDISGSVSGSLFDLGAGPVGAALSGEWRKVSFSSNSDSLPDQYMTCGVIRFSNCTATNTLRETVFGQQPSGVSQTVWEVAGEVDVPLIKDKAFFQSLSVNGAARYTSYNTSGNYWTWKAGLAWEISDQLRVRVTRSRDIRAPSLYELFAPTSQVIVRPSDLLVTGNPTPSVPSIDLSNPNLKAEIANTLTAGVVFKPTSRLSFAVDYYKIDIKDAITQIQGQDPTIQKICYDSKGTSPYCALQVRPVDYVTTSTNNTVTAWKTFRYNLNQVKTWGIDFEANYQGELFGRPMLLRVLAAWQPDLKIGTLDYSGSAFGPNGFGATPAWRVNGMFRFKPSDSLTVDITERWRSAMQLSTDPSQFWVNNHMSPFATTAVNLAWDVEDNRLGQFQFFANVQNLFNAHPPIGAFSGNGTRAGLRDGFAIGDDPRGRTYSAGVRMKF
ncbi:TonB-dependent receptor [Novosphingobium flavum]|uniref:TonB-dependent receptor n=1 Tax=Novosphingobium flavum TaxID=1778672 RepID=A0A7X1FU43_9SPHN|nr:TonB-dependent receptor [Novosphingobium flavum]MBC2667024.1 TonB-dependent receptor [Novosphingobium flavum]